MKNCYITQMELISPLGLDINENFSRIKANESALRQKKFRSVAEPLYCATFTEEQIEKIHPSGSTERKYTKLEKLSIATINSLLQADIDPTDPKLILIICTTKGNIDLLFEQPEGIPENRVLFARYAETVAEHFGFKNTPLVVSNACISGVEGLLLGKRLIGSGLYNKAIVVAADLVTDFTISGFYSLKAYARGKCRPFDEERSGVNLGECCAGVVLSNHPGESGYSYRIAAGTASNDANHMTAPSREAAGLHQAIRQCLETVEGTSEPDFISAHGTGTRYNDAMESLAFKKSGLAEVPFFSLKGIFGHTLGAAGLLETVIATKAMEEGVILPSAGFEKIGKDISSTPSQKLKQKPISRFLKTASGFGGGNACVLVAKH